MGKKLSKEITIMAFPMDTRNMRHVLRRSCALKSRTQSVVANYSLAKTLIRPFSNARASDSARLRWAHSAIFKIPALSSLTAFSTR